MKSRIKKPLLVDVTDYTLRELEQLSMWFDYGLKRLGDGSVWAEIGTIEVSR